MIIIVVYFVFKYIYLEFIVCKYVVLDVGGRIWVEIVYLRNLEYFFCRFFFLEIKLLVSI